MKRGSFKMEYTAVSGLSAPEIEELWEFTSREVKRDRALFDRMLLSRDGVMRVRDRRSVLRGCGALKTVRFTVDGKRVGCMFASLMTIDPAFRGRGLLQTGVARLVLAEMMRHPMQRTYGVGATGSTAGYKAVAGTSAHFWPAPGSELPAFERAVLHEAMERLIPLVPGRRWVPERGIIETTAAEQWTREPKALDAGAAADSPIARFFRTRNPGQAQGDALAFLVPFNLKNFLPLIMQPLRRWLKRRRNAMRRHGIVQNLGIKLVNLVPDKWQGPRLIRMFGHRQYVGGDWEQMGRLQLDFLRKQGLRKSDYLLDIACGPLRAGVHLIDFLEPGHYLGVDKEQDLIDCGIEQELGAARYREKKPELLVSDAFEFGRFSKKATRSMAQSIFTHLSPADIRKCLCNLKSWASDCHVLYATFMAGSSKGNPGKSHSKRFFQYSSRELEGLGKETGWGVTYLGDWGHPRGQMMMRFDLHRASCAGSCALHSN